MSIPTSHPSAFPSWVWPLFWAFIGALLSLVLGRFYEWYTLRRKSRYLLAIFDFVGDEVIFVVPHRERDSQSIMPRAAFEDLMALKNVVSAVTKLHREIDIKIKDPQHLTADDLKKSLITFGGGKVNSFSAAILNHHQLQFEQDRSGKGWILRRHAGETHESASYAVSDTEAPDVERGDSAVVLKTVNPQSAHSTILVIAGVRGIGTWGAADCIRKQLNEIYRLKRGKKDGDFVFFVEVGYSEFDIHETVISGFHDLPERKMHSRR